jgi:hypothetical protein
MEKIKDFRSLLVLALALILLLQNTGTLPVAYALDFSSSTKVNKEINSVMVDLNYAKLSTENYKSAKQVFIDNDVQGVFISNNLIWKLIRQNPTSFTGFYLDFGSSSNEPTKAKPEFVLSLSTDDGPELIADDVNGDITALDYAIIRNKSSFCPERCNNDIKPK